MCWTYALASTLCDDSVALMHMYYPQDAFAVLMHILRERAKFNPKEKVISSTHPWSLDVHPVVSPCKVHITRFLHLCFQWMLNEVFEDAFSTSTLHLVMPNFCLHKYHLHFHEIVIRILIGMRFPIFGL